MSFCISTLIKFSSIMCSQMFLRMALYGKPCHIGCTDKVSPLCISSDVFWGCYYQRKSFHIGCIYSVSPQHVESHILPEWYYVKKPCQIGCIDKVSLQYVFLDVFFKIGILWVTSFTLTALIRSSPSVCLQMYFEIGIIC